MRFRFCAAFLLTGSLLSAQVASHAPTGVKPAAPATSTGSKSSIMQVTGKTVARVNGASLTDRDLVREMFLIFPYARQHNGFPNDLEPQIRKGALDMIIFEELCYQEAKRRGMTIAPERMAKAERDFRKQFPSQQVYEGYLKAELNNSKTLMREKIRRSLLIEDILRSEVLNKSTVSVAQAKAFYDKNAVQFKRDETFHIQTISILPPKAAGKDIQQEARRRAEDAYNQAKGAKSYREFGLLAEKLSDDDFRVNMGDHKELRRDQVPPEVVKAAEEMKAGQVSALIQLGTAYTVFRLESHTPAGKVPFAEVKSKLQSELQKERIQKLRASLGEQLRKNAKIEKL